MSMVVYQAKELCGEIQRQHAGWKTARANIITPKGLANIKIIAAPRPVIAPVQKPMEIVESKAEERNDFERDWLLVASHLSIADISREVCKQFEVRKNDFLSHRRLPDFVRARQTAMTLSKHLTLKSLPEIGRRIGGRDHTTVLHACRKYKLVMDAVEKKVPKDDPISIWVAAFKAEIEITPVVSGRVSKRKSPFFSPSGQGCKPK